MDPNLGDRLTLTIDPAYQHRNLWQHPLGYVLRVPFVDWESGVTESVSVNYAETDVIGRAEPHKVWLNNSSRQVAIAFHFQVQGINSSTAQAIEEEVIQPARWLDALKYPLFNAQQDVSYRPPPVILKIGTLLTARCVLTAGDIEWQYDQLDTEQLLPHAANFTATFDITRAFKADLSYFPSGQVGGPVSGTWQ